MSKADFTYVIDWQEGQCGFDTIGRAWFKLTKTDSLLISHSNPPRLVEGPGCLGQLDESARQVFIDYFSGKGK